VDTIDNVTSSPPPQSILDRLYSDFYTWPNLPYNFDPYLSFPPAGTCLVQQSSGDASLTNNLRGVLPASASLPQPNQSYNNGTQQLNLSPAGSDYSSALGGTINSVASAMNLLGSSGSYTDDARTSASAGESEPRLVIG
jgi:hypothetical protein